MTRRMRRSLRSGRALACALCALCGPVLLACGGDRIAVAVEMTLDPGTCSQVPDPAAVTLSCDGTAGLWLRAPSGEVIERGCIDVAAGSTLAALPQRLAGIDLSTSRAEGIAVDVALYAPWDASAGCPAPDEIEQQPAPPGVIVSGRSAPVDLSRADRPVEVELACDAIAQPGSPGMCLEGCGEQLVACLDIGALDQCSLDLDQCEEACGPANDECEDACAVTFADCLRDAVQGSCGVDFAGCASGCEPADEDCALDCELDYLDCREVECEQQSDQCEDACAGGDAGCATVGPGL